MLRLRAILSNQTGAFSPFMFGMLAGVAVFSSVMAHWSNQELQRLEQERIAMDKRKTEQVRNALENAILTENIDDPNNSYDADVGLDRARSFLSGTTGKTRGGQDFQVKTSGSSSSFGQQNQRVIITSSDDEFLREEVSALGGADTMAEFSAGEDEPVETFDTKKVRDEQVKRSVEYLQMEASQLYRFYAANDFHFPKSASAYRENVNSLTGLRDVWGQQFTYTYINDTTAKIAFTTPWGYTHTINLDMN